MTMGPPQVLTMRIATIFPRALTPMRLLRSLVVPSLPSPALTAPRFYSTQLPALATTSLYSTSSLFKSLHRQSPLIHRRHATTDTGVPTLTWNEFFRQRKIKRYYNRTASAALAIVSLAGGMSILAQQDLQAIGQQLFGLDPMFVVGLGSVGFLGIGWLFGPSLGDAVWGLVNRYSSRIFYAKEADFLMRIRKYRADPSSSTLNNPLPDYYGEKITSVQKYRSWLKDQRAFNKKRLRFV